MITLRHLRRPLRAGVGDCAGRLIAGWSSFMHVSVYLETESPSQPPYFKNTSFCILGLWLDLDRQIPGPVTGAVGHSSYCPFVVVEITENKIFSGAKYSYPPFAVYWI